MPGTDLSSRTGLPRAKRKAPLRAGAGELRALALAVRAERLRQGLTQAELAGLSGTGVRLIVELEQAKPTLRLDKVLRVAATLGLRLVIQARNSSTHRAGA